MRGSNGRRPSLLVAPPHRWRPSRGRDPARKRGSGPAREVQRNRLSLQDERCRCPTARQSLRACFATGSRTISPAFTAALPAQACAASLRQAVAAVSRSDANTSRAIAASPCSFSASALPLGAFEDEPVRSTICCSAVCMSCSAPRHAFEGTLTTRLDGIDLGVHLALLHGGISDIIRMRREATGCHQGQKKSSTLQRHHHHFGNPDASMSNSRVRALGTAWCRCPNASRDRK